MNIQEFAIHELDLADITDKNPDIYPFLRTAVLDMIIAFGKAGHSGGSAAQTIAIINRILKFEPLTPLSGNDDEWLDCSDVYGKSDGSIFQNIRCPYVFKNDLGHAWVLDVNTAAQRPITFPYMPGSLDDGSQINAVLEEIRMERLRQLNKGYDYDHDDRLIRGELVLAACAYAMDGGTGQKPKNADSIWPVGCGGFNPEDNRTNIKKAVAMLTAEIERIDRQG
jgi:hypothetical protein